MVKERAARRERLLDSIDRRKRLDTTRDEIKETKNTIREKYEVFMPAPANLMDTCNEIAEQESTLNDKRREYKKTEEMLQQEEQSLREVEEQAKAWKDTVATREEIDAIEEIARHRKVLETKKVEERRHASKKRALTRTGIGAVVAIVIGAGIGIAGFTIGTLEYVLIAVGAGLFIAAVVGWGIVLKSLSAVSATVRYIRNEIDNGEKNLEQQKDSLSSDALDMLKRVAAEETSVEEIKKTFSERMQQQQAIDRKKDAIAREKKRAEELEQEISRREEAFNNLKEKVAAYIIDDDIDTTRKRYQQFLALKNKVEILEKQLQAGESYEAIKEKEQQHELDYRTIDAELREFLSDNPALARLRDNMVEQPVETARRHDGKKETLRSHITNLESLNEQEREIRYRLEHMARQGEEYSVETLTEMLDEQKDYLKRLEHRAEAIAIAAHTLSDAIARFEDQYADTVMDSASKAFFRITGGKYRKVEREGTGISVLNTGGISVSPDVLSRGAADQLYLCVRLSLARALSPRITLPIILDDPFVHYDSERLDAVKEVFDRIADTWQIIIFTCHPERYRGWGNVIHEF